MLSKLLAALLCLASLSSCAGYRLGNSKPSELSSVQSVSVPLFKNNTQEQRLAALMTNSMVDSITRDGTYSIANVDSSDAQLIATITSLDYSERRSSRFDTLRASELYMNLAVDWKLSDNQNKVLASGKATGQTQFSLAANQQLSRTNAMADAAKDAAKQITLRLANGF